MSVLGVNTVGSGGTHLVAEGFPIWIKAVAGSSFTAAKLSVYLSSAGTSRATVGVYADNGAGNPGSKIQDSAEVTGIGTTPGWVDFSLDAGVSVVSGTTYWLCIANADSNVSLYYDAGSQGSRYGSGTYSAGTLPSSGGSAEFDSGNTYSIYATEAAAGATTATLTGPTSGTVAVASSNFSIALDGTYTGTITPATSGAGTFSPTSLTWSGTSDTKTFTYTPTSTAGSPHSISISASPSLSYSGSPIGYTVNAAPVTVHVDDVNWFFSPYNWYLAGSTYAQTNNPGAYWKIKFTGTSCVLNVDVSPLTAGSVAAGNYPTIAYTVDGGAWTRRQLASSDSAITLATGLAAGTHSLEVRVVTGQYTVDRWTTPVEVVRVTSLTLDGGASTAAPDLLSGRMILFADSNGEGYEALGVTADATHQDAGRAFPLLLAAALDCEVGVVAFAVQGWGSAGGGNVPVLIDTTTPSNGGWRNYWSGQSRLSGGLLSPVPDWIVSTHGQNDSSDPTAQVAAGLAEWRAAAGGACKIAVCSPSNLNQASAISAAVAGAADPLVKWVTTGINFVGAGSGALRSTNGVHLSGDYGHPTYAADLAADIRDTFAAGTGGGTVIITGF